MCHRLREKDNQTVDQLVAELEASWESRPFTARIRMLRDKINTGKPWMKQPQEPLTTMETGGSLSKGKDGGDLAGRVGFGSKVVAGGNQGANGLTPTFTCHYCKEVGHYKRNCLKLKHTLSSIKSSGKESESLTELCRQGKIEGKPCKLWLDTGANRSAVPSHYIAEVNYTGKEGARLASGTVEMLRTAEVTIPVDGIIQQMTVFVVDKDAKYVLLGTYHKAVKNWVLGKGEQLNHPLCALTRAQSKVKQKQEIEDNKVTVNSGATIKPLGKMSPPKEAESELVSSSREVPPMEVGAFASAEEEGGIVVEKGKDEEAKVLEPSDLEEEGSLAGDEGGSNSWLPTPSLVNSREEVASR